MTKADYTNAKNKKLVRDFIFNKFYFENVVGLPGPNINEYLEYLKKEKGINNFELYEYNSKISLFQLSKINVDANIELKCKDIIHSVPDKENTLYDLDFCGTVLSFKEHIQKFKKNFVMTFSTRIGVAKTIFKFFEFRNEEILNFVKFENPLKHVIFTTNKADYLFLTYFDTSAMCSIARLDTVSCLHDSYKVSQLINCFEQLKNNK